METNRKRRYGDRKDAYLVRDLDAMHKFTPYLLPNRCDNEAVMSELIELDAVNKYVAKKNEANPNFKYTLFHVLCAATVKTIALRPKLNWFVQGHRVYERKAISISFVVKKKFQDDSYEALAILDIDRQGDSPVEQIHSKVEKFVTAVRKHDMTDGTTDVMDTLTKLPRWLVRIIVGILMWLDYHGWVPSGLTKDDPYNSSVFVSNLGSIKMHASYHHLTNWGTNSLFAIIDEKHMHPFYDENGSVTMKEALRLGLTVDERIADGVYFANSVRLLKKLLAEPELLDLPIDTPVEY
ncbi:MAG: 2-oxo acid dehydrogenase subunit E2 [Christensenellaceae bacterium]|nr:2-oxo acid dehydrogenase subunit E2 [Christensenellaceae bacterium]